MVIPDGAVEHILRQRTGLQWFPRLSRWMPLLISAQASEDPGSVKGGYETAIRKEFESLAPYLPNECESILDIGCGVGGMDVLLYDCMDDPKPTMTLVDRTEVKHKLTYGFSQAGQFHNSLDATREMMQVNGIPEKDVDILSPDEWMLRDAPQLYDLVVSLLSCGFHYPLSVYIDRIRVRAEKGALGIFDVRKGTSWQKDICGYVDSIKIIDERKKSYRIAVKFR